MTWLIMPKMDIEQLPTGTGLLVSFILHFIKLAIPCFCCIYNCIPERSWYQMLTITSAGNGVAVETKPRPHSLDSTLPARP